MTRTHPFRVLRLFTSYVSERAVLSISYTDYSGSCCNIAETMYKFTILLVITYDSKQQHGTKVLHDPNIHVH